MPYIFKHTDPIEDITIEMTVNNNEIHINTILSNFEDFLRACGFSWIKCGSINYLDPDTEEISQKKIVELSVPPTQEEFKFGVQSARGNED